MNGAGAARAPLIPWPSLHWSFDTPDVFEHGLDPQFTIGSALPDQRLPNEITDQVPCRAGVAVDTVSRDLSAEARLEVGLSADSPTDLQRAIRPRAPCTRARADWKMKGETATILLNPQDRSLL